MPPSLAPARKKSRRVTGTQFAIGLFALASAIGLLLFVDRYLTRVTAGRQDDWLRVLIEELSGAYVAALLIPLMVYGTRRLPPFGRSRWRSVVATVVDCRRSSAARSAR